MKATMVGIQEIKFKGDDGKPVEMHKLHCLCSDDYVSGTAVMTVSIMTSKCKEFLTELKTYPTDAEMNIDIDVEFNQKGKVVGVSIL